MKIAFLSRYQLINNRGVEVFAQELSKRLSKSHQVDILSGSDSDNLSLVLTRKYDVVIPLNGRLQSLKFSLGKIKGGYKVLISGHSGVGRDDIWNIVIARPDVFVALTDYMYQWAKKWALGIKVEKIPNGIDLAKFTPEGEKKGIELPGPIILSVGALTWYKHHEKVIEVVSRLKKGSLLVVGDGPDKDKLIWLAEQKLKGRYQIMSAPYEQMPSIYRSVDLFTLPSWSREAFGIAYLEALASNIPVIAPDDESRREIVGDGGILVDVNNMEKYTQAVEEALEKDWKNQPRAQAEKFSWDIVSDRYQKIMEDMVNG